MPADRTTATPSPDDGGLHQAALNYLARYAATEAGLRRVLLRRIDRWVRAQVDVEAAESVAAEARAAVDGVVKRLAEAGAVSDAAFAESKARGLNRAGQSSRSVQMRLVAKGVAPELAREAAAMEPEAELAAALVLTRKRRIGAYRAGAADAVRRAKELGMLARVGFSRDVAERALDMAHEDAEARIFELRR